ncbi:MAG TPA: VCBS repeat-containing protein [Puia sp.]|nr:VCBS repeat-containing protein [Puia sp.]
MPVSGYHRLLLATALLLTVSCHRAHPVFVTMPDTRTNIHFTNTLEKTKLLNILYYLYYYNGGGVAIGDINNDGLPDIYFTANHYGGNKLYLNKGNFEFEDITDKAGVAGTADWCTGATMADVNGDGLLDIYVSTVSQRYGLKGHNMLFINKGNSRFEEESEKMGLDTRCFTSQAVFFDYDHDGDLDCFILNQSHHPNENIVDTSHRRDYDSLSGARLYRNDLNTTGKFTDVSKQAGIYQSSLGYGLGISVGDLNNDGWDDIYIGNDFHENDYYYINHGDGTFTESGAKHFGHYSRFSMGNDIADYNNDGQPDIVTVDMLPPDEKTLKTYGSDENANTYRAKLTFNGFQDQYSRNCLQRNNGSGVSFSDVALIAGIPATDWSWCPLFADFDNDGNKDLFISSGIVKRPVDLDYIRYVSDMKYRGLDKTMRYDDKAIESIPDGSSHPFLFRGDGKEFFSDVSDAWGTGQLKGYYNGAAYADLDNDGRLDLVINAINATAPVLRNEAPARSYLSISFKGSGMNTFGIGAKTYLWTHNAAGTSQLQFQELMLTRGFQSSSDTRLHFGLDSAGMVDSLLVVWPDQAFQLLRNVPANRQMTLEQKNASGKFVYAAFFPSGKTVLENITSRVICPWRHQEDDFNDFNVQYLIPHQESTRGPKIAVGDVNKDGLDDFYACGARGQAGALMIQQPDGSFHASDTALFAKYALCEDVDAVFFDANGDGWPDLLVISGGNEPQVNSPQLLQDRLYLNDGTGHFKEKKDFLVQRLYNKSCVAIADVNHDGAPDIFIGTLANTYGNQFGQPMTSYLFLNDGKGKFEAATYQTIQLSNLGTVTSACFADINHDGWPDLLVTGEWMPLKVFMNDHGKFTETDIPHSTGLWQNLYVTDINGDGYPDLLAGNWGHNSKLWSGKDGPLKLYIKDFDGNGTVEQVLCYTSGGKEYTFLAKDELERALPVLKKAYLRYDEVAGKTVQYMFYDLFKDYRELTAETLGSACFINDGKGNFVRTDLPYALQLAPIFAFAALPGSQPGNYVAGGNFYGTIPYEGKYDALFPTLFSFDKDRPGFEENALLPDARGEIRDLKWVHTAKFGDVLVAARNNDSLLFFQYKNERK